MEIKNNIELGFDIETYPKQKKNKATKLSEFSQSPVIVNVFDLITDFFKKKYKYELNVLFDIEVWKLLLKLHDFERTLRDNQTFE